jgi:hypothetical protein
MTPRVPVKPAGGACGDRPVQAPPEVSVFRSLTWMSEVVCTPFVVRHLVTKGELALFRRSRSQDVEP